jgi:hypothetical protein
MEFKVSLLSNGRFGKPTIVKAPNLMVAVQKYFTIVKPAKSFKLYAVPLIPGVTMIHTVLHDGKPYISMKVEEVIK